MGGGLSADYGGENMGFFIFYDAVLIKMTSALLMVVLKGVSVYKKCHRFKPMTKVNYKIY